MGSEYPHDDVWAQRLLYMSLKINPILFYLSIRFFVKTVGAMSASAFAAITTFCVVLFCETTVPFGC